MVGPACPEAGPAALPGRGWQGGGDTQSKPVPGGGSQPLEPGWPIRPAPGGGWKHNLHNLVYRIEKFLRKLCTVIFAQYLRGFLFLVGFFFVFS